jgi:membrane associated rhomboid family serine protease
MATRRRSLLASPTVQTIAVFLVVYLLSRVFVAVYPPLIGLFVLDQPFGQPWTLVTSVYSHASIPHLLSNAIMLVFVGVPLERSTTTWAYHAYFVTTGAIAGAVQVLVPDLVATILGVIDLLTLGVFDISATPGTVAVLGASGAVFAVLGYVVTGNRFTRGAFGSLGVKTQWAIIIGIALAVTWFTASPGVALIAHFVGLALGLVAGSVGLLPSRNRRGSHRQPGNTSYKNGRR